MAHYFSWSNFFLLSNTNSIWNFWKFCEGMWSIWSLYFKHHRQNFKNSQIDRGFDNCPLEKRLLTSLFLQLLQSTLWNWDDYRSFQWLNVIRGELSEPTFCILVNNFILSFASRKVPWKFLRRYIIDDFLFII